MQSAFMVAAPVDPDCEADLRTLLATMNRLPGFADPDNELVPFGRFETLHFARFVILRDTTLGDLAAYGSSFPDAPVWLVLLGECDGPAPAMLVALAERAGAGLRRIFAFCRGFDEGADLLAWLRTREVQPAAFYVNWRGRSVRRIREEASLHRALRAWLDENGAALANAAPTQVRDRLIAYVAAEQRAGRLALTPEPAPDATARLRELLTLIGVPLLLLALAPALIVLAPLFLWILRRHETRDPVIAPRPAAAHLAELTRREDHDVSNQFSAFGCVKPGLFRLGTLRALLWLLDWSMRAIYVRGRLARVPTIHFARWAFLDGQRRLLFASSYDGSLDSYMDDFINKVAWGLNLVFSNGIGYPATRFLIGGGAKDELAFKAYIRRHELPTEVWYEAYPGLGTVDLACNTRLREGLERAAMDADAARHWLALI